MERAERVLEARVLCAGIDHRGQSELFYSREALHEWMFHNIEKQSTRYLDEPEDRVVDYLAVVQFYQLCLCSIV